MTCGDLETNGRQQQVNIERSPVNAEQFRSIRTRLPTTGGSLRRNPVEFEYCRNTEKAAPLHIAALNEIEVMYRRRRDTLPLRDVCQSSHANSGRYQANPRFVLPFVVTQPVTAPLGPLTETRVP